MTRRARWFIFLLFPLLTSYWQDREQPDFDRYDELLAAAEEANDTTAFFRRSDEKMAAARRADSLGVWAETLLLCQEQVFEYPKPALAYLDRALRERWRAPANAREREVFAHIETARGWNLFRLGKVWESIQAYEAAAAAYESDRYPDFEPVEYVYKPLGNHYTRLGDNEKALIVFQKALALSDADPESAAGLYNNIGIACWNQGDWAQSEKYYAEGLRLSGVSPQKKALLLGGLARTCMDAGRPAQAYETARRALQALRHSNDALPEHQARIRLTAALACMESGRLIEVEPLLKLALRDALAAFGAGVNRDAGKIEIAFGDFYARTGRSFAALDAANRALSRVLPGFSPRQAAENPSPDLFYEENVIFEALAAKASAAEACFGETQERQWLELALACHDLAREAELKQRAVFIYQSAKLRAQQTARERETAALRAARALYELTNDAQYAQKAFQIAERSKAGLLLDALQDNLIRQKLSGTDARFEQLKRLRQNIAYLEQKLLAETQHAEAAAWRVEADRLRAEAALLEKAVRNDYPALLAALQSPDGASAASPRVVGPDALLLEYFAAPDAIDIFMVRPDGAIAWDRQSYDTAFQREARDFRAFFAQPSAILNNPAGYMALAYQLGQRLLPTEACRASRLVIAPDAWIAYIPFEALLSGTPQAGDNLRNAPYLIKGTQVQYAWSLATLARQKQLKSSAERYFLGLAPAFIGKVRGLAPLAYSQEEWAEAGDDVQALVDEQANASALETLAGDYRIVHLSTHARADQPPRIELYDRAVLLPEIYALPLQSDLAVLSACETGMGQDQSGEGVMSLARAFAYAGSACIISSLWTANDRGATRLFRFFYRDLSAGNSIAASLREAKLSYIDNPSIGAAFASPYFWAGFVAVGDAERSVTMAGPPYGLWAAGIAAFAILIWLYARLRKKVGWP